MKHWNRRLGVKITCFILTPILLALAVAGCFGMALLWEEGIYSSTQEALERENYLQKLDTDGSRMLWQALDSDTGEITIPPQADLLTWPSNLKYRLTDHNGTLLATNLSGDQENMELPMRLVFGVFRQDYDGSEEVSYYQLLHKGNDQAQEGDLVILAGVDPQLPVNDDYKLIHLVVELGYSLRYWGYAIIAALLVLALVCFINLLATASRRAGSDELFPGPLHKAPSDLVAGLTVFFFFWFPEAVLYNSYNLDILFAPGVFWIAAGLYLGLGLLVGGFGRLKQGSLLKNTLIWKLCGWLRRLARKLGSLVKYLWRHLSMVWRSVLLAGGFGLWAFWLVVDCFNYGGWLWLLLPVVPLIMGFIVYSGIALRRLQQAGQALAQGDLSYQLDTRGLYGDLKTHGENLNSIGTGMARAVDARLKSERMKAELVTNVSHDIKNPLTSIINYAGLIAQEECDCANHREYAQVLARKGEHLKRLLEDLVEISKANTGNMEVELLPCDAGTLLEQLAGEFQERCEAAGLRLMIRHPEEALRIRVDSRRIWRVFENLMQNACKYSLTGSRVYLALEQVGDAAVFSFRNTSREPLDITPEELMERFVRGDSARTTEGNGLGLSIAQSLTQLQGGEMRLTIDGDLFKVTLTFPLAQ